MSKILDSLAALLNALGPAQVILILALALMAFLGLDELLTGGALRADFAQMFADLLLPLKS